MQSNNDRADLFQSFLNITENRSKILAAILSMTNDFEVADDLFQECVLEILKNSDKYDQERDFLPWACGIARNIVRNYWRTSQKAPSIMSQDILESISKIVITNEEEDLWMEERKAMYLCLQNLPERLRNLLVLRYAQNIKGPRLAELSQYPAGSIRTTLSRLRKKLRHCINTQIEQSV